MHKTFWHTIILLLLTSPFNIGVLFANVPQNCQISEQHDTKQPNIILVTIPKSGSTYIAATLIASLKYEYFKLDGSYNKATKSYNTNLADFFEKPGRISKVHLHGEIYGKANYHHNEYFDFDSLKNYTNKIVVHVRDPHQVLLSRVHHAINFKELDPIPRPENFDDMSLQQKIDWGIEYFLPEIVSWMNEWYIIKEQQSNLKDGMQILITTYDELITDEKKLFAKILNFYGIDSAGIQFLTPEKNAAVFFRKGDPEEWEHVFTAEQKERIDKIVPRNLRSRFSWTAR